MLAKPSWNAIFLTSQLTVYSVLGQIFLKKCLEEIGLLFSLPEGELLSTKLPWFQKNCYFLVFFSGTL